MLWNFVSCPRFSPLKEVNICLTLLAALLNFYFCTFSDFRFTYFTLQKGFFLFEFFKFFISLKFFLSSQGETSGDYKKALVAILGEN